MVISPDIIKTNDNSEQKVIGIPENKNELIPSNWDLREIGEDLYRAQNSETNRVLTCSMAEFNKFLRGGLTNGNSN